MVYRCQTSIDLIGFMVPSAFIRLVPWMYLSDSTDERTVEPCAEPSNGQSPPGLALPCRRGAISRDVQKGHEDLR